MNDDQRSNFRCPVTTASEDCAVILHGERGDVPLRLADQSSSGFGLVASAVPPGVEQGQSLMLSTRAGLFRVLVAHISEIEGGVRIGLQRQGEIKSLRDDSYDSSRQRRRTWKTVLAHVAGYAAVFALTATIVSYMNLPSWGGGQHPPLVDTPQVASTVGRVTEEEVRLAENFLRLHQLRKAPLVSTLNLSSQQEKDIQYVVHQTMLAMESVYKNRQNYTDQEWTEVGMQLLQTAAQRVHGTLTPQQRLRWARLLEEQAVAEHALSQT